MEKVGDFGAIAYWHPAVEKCVLSADGKQRTLSVKGASDADAKKVIDGIYAAGEKGLVGG